VPLNVSYKTHSYRIWFRSGPHQCGKSSTIQKLAGQLLSEKGSPTPGVSVTVIYWPAKVAFSGEIVMFRLELWEAGTSAAARFQNLEQMCNPDGIVLTFSSVDRNTFDTIPEVLSEIEDEVVNDPLMLLVATHADRYLAAEVAESEARTFARDNQLHLLRTQNLSSGEMTQRSDSHIDGWTSINDCAPILFTLCDLLWKRDALIAQQGVDV